MTTIYAIQNAPSETPGLIAEVLQRAQIRVECIRPFKRERVPRRMGKYAGLVIMGGPMGVYEQDRYPFLRSEIRLVEQALSKEKPILGICLGSQLLASALGARVTKGKRKEIGWRPVTLMKAAAGDVLWNSLPASFTAYHWHGDIFDLPCQAVSLAKSSLTHCQAFRHGASAYGILFHMEVTGKIIQRMTKSFRGELEEAGMDARLILRGVKQHLASLQEIGTTVFHGWAQLAKTKGAE